jgi:hypothetical protein
MAGIVTSGAKVPPSSREGKISPSIAEASITPEAKNIISPPYFAEKSFIKNPNTAPKTVAPPTPNATKTTSSKSQNQAFQKVSYRQFMKKLEF